jgi:hypothetical protein
MAAMKHWLKFGLLCIALFLASPALAQEVEVSDDARRHFTAGVNFMQDPDGARYEEAYREFKAAYAASPSWKILGNLGIAAMKLERDAEAITAMEKYLEQGAEQLPADERAQFERDLSTLRASVVRVKLQSAPPGAVVTDERVPVQGAPITNRYSLEAGEFELGVRTGHHRMTARLAGYEDAVWEFDAAPGADQTHVFEMKPRAVPVAAAPGQSTLPPDRGVPTGYERPTPASVYVGLAATGAFTAGAVVTGVLALGKKSDFDDANTGATPDEAEDLSSSTKSMNLVTDVLIGAAVVSAAVTTYLYLDRPEVPVGQEQGALKLEPLLGRDAALMSLSGRF